MKSWSPGLPVESVRAFSVCSLTWISIIFLINHGTFWATIGIFFLLFTIFNNKIERD